MQPEHTVTVEEAVLALAVAGDLSMGQPPDQSIRTARLAARLAQLDGAGAQGCAEARLVALLRWSGCTANAAGFATLLGDDVGGRGAMLAHTLAPGHGLNVASVAPLAHIHCEVAGDIARMLGLSETVEAGLRHIFEQYGGGGVPYGLQASQIPAVVYYANLAGDLDILARVHGSAEALRLIRQMAGHNYPAALVDKLVPHADAWLAALRQPEPRGGEPAQSGAVPLTIVADIIELKLPWLAGYSRRVSELAERSAALAGLAPETQQCLGRAALIHGIGRAAVPNAVWERGSRPDAADWEKIRLAPYWTGRVAAQVPGWRSEAALASCVYERLDGSGYFRGLEADALGMPQRLLGAAAAYAALCMARPWRASHSATEAARILGEEAMAGRFDAGAVGFVLAAAGGAAPVPASRRGLLSEREAEVLRRISLGESNKEAARELRISPSTVRTHMESIFRKLACSTRAAATLKALTLGLI